MLYSMKENRINYYIYKEFNNSLNQKSKAILIRQFKESRLKIQLVCSTMTKIEVNLNHL